MIMGRTEIPVLIATRPVDFRKQMDGLAALAAKYSADVALIDAGAGQLKKLEAAAAEADKRYIDAATKLARSSSVSSFPAPDKLVLS